MSLSAKRLSALAFLTLLSSASALSSASGRDQESPTSAEFARSDITTGRHEMDEIVVPVTIEGGHVIVDVTINGQGPFPMILDTGSPNVVTPETASAVGLAVKGGGMGRGSGESDVAYRNAEATELKVGKTNLVRQPIIIVPLPRSLIDRGARPPIAGLLGRELFTQFAVRLDCAGKRLGLTPSEHFHYSGTGERLSLSLIGKTPAVSAPGLGWTGVSAMRSSTSSLSPSTIHAANFGLNGRRRLAQGPS